MDSSTKSGPEIVIGLIGPIGCDIDQVQKALAYSLHTLQYDSSVVQLSQGIADLLERKKLSDNLPLVTLDDKISGGNKVRQLYQQNGILAAWAIAQIRNVREFKNKSNSAFSGDADPKQTPISRTAYIVRQLKRLEEVELLRKTYGNKFITVSIVEEKTERESNLKRRIRKENSTMSSFEVESKARTLMHQDEDERNDEYGQRLIDIFHLSDVFIDARNRQTIARSTYRFLQALFGKTDISPTRDEFGCYLAKSASLRSVDLSRQVGAAISSKSGDLITIGCNEVPKPGGGNYWDEDDHKHRDIDLRSEANREEKDRIIQNFLEVLENSDVLGERTAEEILGDIDIREKIESSEIGQITEYGRMVHAEMNAIADAARLGRSIDGASMYVTTFPCHNCAKHIIASGIGRVVFIEPYTKSRTDLLYGYALGDVQGAGGKVVFQHFTGIAPGRFLDIFQKRGRLEKGRRVVQEYYEGRCEPRIGGGEINHIENEALVLNENFAADEDEE